MQNQIFSSEGADIFPEKPNYGPHQYFCSPHGSSPVKTTCTCISRIARTTSRLARMMMLVALALAAVAALAQQPQTIDSIRVIGNRRIPKETVLARLFTHPGDTFDPVSIERDFNSLWNTSYFENLRIEREDSEKGIILNIFVKERPTIREINYKGLNAVSQSDVLDRFKKEKVGLTVESQYDPAKIMRAVTVLKDILSEHGHQFATIKPDIKNIPRCR
jgi:outer membrane protein insertion porin family